MKKAIKEYIANQLQQDKEYEQLSIKEFIDPFTGEPVNKQKRKPSLEGSLRKYAVGSSSSSLSGSASNMRSAASANHQLSWWS